MSGNHRTVESNLTSSLEDTQHDPRYLLMFLSPLSIRKSLYEGGNPGEALEYLEHLLNAKFDELEPELHFSPPIKSKALKIIQKMNEAYRLIVRYPHTGLTPLKNFISQSLKEDNYCYLPLFWLGDNAHAYVLKFRTSEQGTLVSAINLGSGVQYHPLIVEKDQQAYFDYRSAEMRFDFEQQLSVSFLESMVAIANDRPNQIERSQQQPYCEEDLYSQLFALDPTEQNTINFSRAARAQATGTCSVTSIEKALFDGLLGSSIFEHDIQNFMLTLKEHALLNALATSQQPNDGKRGLWALQNLWHEFNELCHQHSFGFKQSEKKLALYQHLENALTLKATESHPNIEFELPENFTVTLDKEPEYNEQSEPSFPEETNYKRLVLERFYLTRPCKEVLLNNLEEFITVVQRITDKLERAELIEQYFKAFYYVEVDIEYWKYFDNEKGEQLIELLSTLIQLYKADVYFLSGIIPIDKKVEVTITTLTAFNIAAMVAQNIDSLAINDSYAIGIEEEISSLTVKDASQYQQLKRLMMNFTKRMEGKKIILSNTMQETPVWLQTITNEEEKEKAARLKEEHKCSDKLGSISFYTSLLSGVCYSKNHNMKSNFNPNRYLSKTKTNLIQLSLAYHDGCHKSFKETPYYNRGDKTLSHYSSRVQIEKRMAVDLEYNDHHHGETYKGILKRLPALTENEYSDFSENLIFHPEYDLEESDHSDLLYDLSNTGWLYNVEWFNVKPLTSPESSEDFKAISTNPFLQVSEVLIWAGMNLEKLKDKKNQEIIEEHLFRFGLIEYALGSSSRASLKIIKQFLEKSLQSYYPGIVQDEQHNQTFLWLYHLQAHLKLYLTHLSNEYNLFKSHASWPDFDSVLGRVDYLKLPPPLCKVNLQNQF